MLFHPQLPPKYSEAGGTPRKLSISALPRPWRGPAPGPHAPARAHAHSLPPSLARPHQVVADARRLAGGSAWAAEGRVGEGAPAAPHPEERWCARPEPGRRVTATGDEGTALTGKSGHRGRGSEGTRDGSASGGDSKKGGGWLWQRTLRCCWPVDSQTGAKAREARSGICIRAPRSVASISLNFRLPSTRPQRPESTTSWPRCARRPCLRRPREPAARRGPGTSGPEMRS